MNIKIEVDSDALDKAFKQAPVKVGLAIRGWVGKTAAMAEREEKEELRSKVSAGASGETINSIRIIQSMSGLKAEVKPTSKHAYYVHEGRAPGKMPPFQEGTPLNRWARRVGANPFVVARAIAKNGTKGIPFITAAFRTVKPKAESEGRAMLSDLVRSI